MASREDYPRTADPSPLTTAQILREIEALKELAFTRIGAVEKAVDVAHRDLVRVPTDVEKAVGGLAALIDEKFKTIQERFNTEDQKFTNIEIQFQERDKRVEQSAKDSKIAIAAALQAQKESAGEQNKSSALSIAKSETATIKQIDQQGQLLDRTTGALGDQLVELRERLNRLEGENRGQIIAQADQRSHSTSNLNVISLVIGSLIALIGIGVALALRF